MKKVAVIGAGLAGLTVAHHLQQQFAVTVFDKANRPGGRLACRQVDDFLFDHGAQFFTVKTPAFADFLQPLIAQGKVARWDAKFVEFEGSQSVASRQWDDEFPHYVGSPDMNAMARALVVGLDIQPDIFIQSLHRQQTQHWQLLDAQQHAYGPFDWVVLALPAEQAVALWPEQSHCYADLQAVKMLPCFAMMLGFDSPPDIDWQAALVREADISWMSVNSSKPDRRSAFSMVVHATNAWAAENLNTDLDTVKQHLLAEIQRVSGIDVKLARHIDVKRWVYANLPKQAGAPFFVDQQQQLAACGDWCIQGRVEAAFTSASALSQHLLSQQQTASVA